MGIINVLDFETANLIAAGEVVERPASVVKELLENSIDAGADKITVEIKGGGTRLIRITDNGCGMTKDDLPRCILRHATSKIRTGGDLEAIGTLGFRGEALAATAAVSKMTVISRVKNSEANKMTVEFGSVTSVEEASAPVGTSISVTELFANVPARRKFLKRDITEGAAVQSVCEKLAISSPYVSLTFISEGEKKFSTAADGSVSGAVYAVLGRQIASDMIQIKSTSEGITVYGVLAQPVNARTNRAMELFFLNGRYIKSTVISAALEAGVQSFIPKEKFPAAVIYLSVHPSYVDVNVHPTKTEVKFSSDRAVFDAVYYAVKSSVTSRVSRPEYDIPSEIPLTKPKIAHSFVPIADTDEKPLVQSTVFDSAPKASVQLKIKTETEAPPEILPTAVKNPTYDFSVRSGKSQTEPDNSTPPVIKAEKQDNSKQPVIKKEESEKEPPIINNEEPEIHNTDWTYIGQAFDTYLFVQISKNEVLIIDKHAAHERMIFEQLKKGVRAKTEYTQLICIPLEVTLSAEEEAAAKEFAEELKSSGFDFTVSDGIASITELPSNLTEPQALDLFISAVSELASGEGGAALAKSAIYEKALYQSCCKAAIKGGDISSDEEMKQLIQHLLDSPDITYCPHGRPVAFRMTKSAIEKRFGRD